MSCCPPAPLLTSQRGSSHWHCRIRYPRRRRGGGPQDGKLKWLGRVDMRRDLLAAFTGQLLPGDIVVDDDRLLRRRRPSSHRS